jgi:hypothetical protein
LEVSVLSRSRKHKPAGGVACCQSEKDDKKIWHGRYRTRCDEVTKKAVDDEDAIMPLEKEQSNQWSMGKDGKIWYKHRWINPKDCNPELIKKSRKKRDARKRQSKRQDNSDGQNIANNK